MGSIFNLIILAIAWGFGYFWAVDTTVNDCRQKGETTFLSATFSCTEDKVR